LAGNKTEWIGYLLLQFVRRILNLGGSVVDAAIAVLLCVGFHTCHSSGIGDGFVMNIYDWWINEYHIYLIWFVF
jgi:gamma-glutamyltranspeptidase